jgi:hypothetical protein
MALQQWQRPKFGQQARKLSSIMSMAQVVTFTSVSTMEASARQRKLPRLKSWVSCYIPPDCKKKDAIWTHTDQAPSKKGLKCIQGFVALTNNKERTLVVYEGSHKLHEEYAKEYNLTSTKDWLLIEHKYLEKISDKKRVLNIKAGSLVLWDSRTFHQNQYGNNDTKEERIVQYVSYLPRCNLSKKMFEKRQKYFTDKRTTSHWAYPVKVNGQQPQNYGNAELKINYSELVKPKLEDLLEEITNIL